MKQGSWEGAVVHKLAGRAGAPGEGGGSADSQSHFLPRRLEGHWPGPSDQLGVCWGENRGLDGGWVLRCMCVDSGSVCVLMFIPFSEPWLGQEG